MEGDDLLSHCSPLRKQKSGYRLQVTGYRLQVVLHLVTWSSCQLVTWSSCHLLTCPGSLRDHPLILLQRPPRHHRPVEGCSHDPHALVAPGRPLRPLVERLRDLRGQIVGIAGARQVAVASVED